MPDRAAAVGDRAQLASSRLRQCGVTPLDAGVGGDQRLRWVVHLDRVPEAVGMDVRQVDEDPRRVSCAHEIAAARQSGPCLGAAIDRRGGDAVDRVRQMHQGHADDRSIRDRPAPSGAASKRCRPGRRAAHACAPVRARLGTRRASAPSRARPPSLDAAREAGAGCRSKTRQRPARRRNGLVVIDHIAPVRPPSRHARQVDVTDEVARAAGLEPVPRRDRSRRCAPG